jgi:hypothetical protein
MKRWVCAISGFLIAFLALGFQVVEAKTIYIGVSNPDMSFLSGGVAHFQGYFKDEGLSCNPWSPRIFAGCRSKLPAF